MATIGFFDGVHRGHRFVIDRLRAVAHERGLPALVVTFAEHPRQVLQPGFRPGLLTTPQEKLDLLRRQLYIQSRSFDEVARLCRSHDEMLLCIPAIQPISNKDLKKTASGYGVRVDPIYKTTKFHSGMDFSANTGTDVYATGNGTVVSAGWETGYGNTIEINHGFGYRTRYAHLHSISVKKGEKVVRGAVIGTVGSTGKSTGPHLHYEVVVKGEKVNPVNYYFMDLSAEDYDKMIQMAANHGKVYD